MTYNENLIMKANPYMSREQLVRESFRQIDETLDSARRYKLDAWTKVMQFTLAASFNLVLIQIAAMPLVKALLTLFAVAGIVLAAINFIDIVRINQQINRCLRKIPAFKARATNESYHP